MSYSDPSSPSSDRGALDDKLGSYASPDVPEGFAFELQPALHPRPRPKIWPLLLIILILLLLGLRYCLPNQSNEENKKLPVRQENIAKTKLPQPAPVAPDSPTGNRSTFQESRTGKADGWLGSDQENDQRQRTLVRDQKPLASQPPTGQSLRSPLGTNSTLASSDRSKNVPAAASPLERSPIVPLMDTVSFVVPIATSPLTANRQKLPGGPTTKPWSVRLTASAVTTNQGETRFGNRETFLLGYRLNKHLDITSGIGREELRSQHRFAASGPARIYQPGTVDSIFRTASGIEIRRTTTDTVSGGRNVRFAHSDQMRSLFLPLSLNWEARHGRLRYGGGMLLAYHFAQKHNLVRVNETGTFRDLRSFRQHRLSYQVMLAAGLSLNGRTDLYLQCAYGGTLDDWGGQILGTPGNLHTFSAGLGIKYTW